MTGDGACGGDMPTFPSPAHGEIPPVGDPAYDAMLARTLPPGDAPAGLGPVAEAFAALRAAPADSGMTAEASALAAFRGAVGRPSEPARPRRRRHPMLTSLLSAKLAAARRGRRRHARRRRRRGVHRKAARASAEIRA